MPCTIVVDAPKVVSDEQADFASSFSLGEYLGRGAYGEVKRCTSRSDGLSYAVKFLDKSRMSKEAEEATEEEIDVMRDLDHKNVVRMYHCFRSPVSYHIVMELIHGGELFDAIVERDHYSEKDALTCIRQVLLALQYCHSQGIVHRDLKPENLLLSHKMTKDEPMDDVVIKLVDFGLALRLPEGKERVNADTRGTPYCIAPETLRQEPLGCPVDMWACGAVFYFMLVGMPPFWPGEGSYGQSQMYVRIVNGQYTFDNPEWESVSTRTRSLVQKMLIVDQDERLSATTSLRVVTSLMGETYLRSLNRQETLHRMKAFRGKQRLNHNGVLQLIAARRKIMENRDKEVRQVTPNFLRRLSSTGSVQERSSDNGSPISAPSSESEKDSLPPPEAAPRIRKRSKSMKEKREQHLEEMFENCHKQMTQPKPPRRRAKEQRATATAAPSTASDSTTVDNGRVEPQTAHFAPAATTTTLSVSTIVTGVKARKSVEMVGVETVVKERHRRRISMLAELEPGNHRLEWSQYEEEDTSNQDISLSKSFSGRLPSSGLDAAPMDSQYLNAPKSPRRASKHQQTIAALVEESGSSASSSCDSSAASTPELAHRNVPPVVVSDPVGSGGAAAVGVSRLAACDVTKPSGVSASPVSCRRVPSLAAGVQSSSKQCKQGPRTPVFV